LPEEKKTMPRRWHTHVRVDAIVVVAFVNVAAIVLVDDITTSATTRFLSC
jgi:hypothetical protein